jgi:hypothetical protein
MGASEFTGMRKVTIRDTATGNTGDFVVMNPEKVGSDGMSIPLEVNEVTESSMAGDVTAPNGVNVGAATLSLIPKSKDDLAAIWPQGFDATTGSWQPPLGECILSDVTIAYEKVCDTKANVILRHAQIALSFELALARDDTFTAEIMVYPTVSLGSEYGLAGDFATKMIPYQIYDGVYDPSTDVIAFDPEAS